MLSYVPALGLVYKEVEFADVFTEEADNLGNNLIPVIKDTTQLLNNILGSQVYDSTNLSLKIESETGILYGNVLSIKSKTENASSDGIILANKILNRIDFNWLANLVSGCKTIAGNAPQILGQNESKTYLVLFENNMELRPTGGFIGSFGLITFDGGRLSDLTVNDVYSADGQLNGHVEPPAPIKNYLGEANWWLRDSNWDPDFPTSAKRAEWFLDKELSKKVDGVLAIDLFPIKEILKNTGPVFLPDYNLDITSDNLYENIQNEVQNNSFLQTHQKASFLTALSRNLLVAAVKLKVDQELSLVKTFYDSLNGRHIQVYLHGDTTQSALSGLQWDGAVGNPSCGGDCYADTVGIVEANVGDNKSNYFIERSVTLNLNIGASQVGHKLILNLKNTANPALGVSGKYKNYVRLLMSSDASLVSVRESVGDNYQDLTPEITDVKGHKEVGVLVELLGGENKNIEFVWNSNTDNSNSWRSYMLYFRKQAGVENYPLDIDVIGGSQLLADTRFALTKTGTYSYNTTLTRDFFSRFSW